MKRYDVYGLGNGLVDIFLELTDEEFAELELERGTMRLVEVEEQQQLLEKFAKSDPVLVSGGSVANSMIALTQLGGKAAFACTLGDDRYGLHYKSEFDGLGIEIGNPLIVSASTGTVVVIVTPDAERTMRTCLGVASHLSDKHIAPEQIAQSEWIFIEGYLFSNPESGQRAIRRAIEEAKRHRCKIAITFSEAWVVESFSGPLREAVAEADLVFANETEARAFTGTTNIESAVSRLAEMVPNYIVTAGADGAYLRYGESTGKVDAFPCRPVDLTGAGDMFAGAFLYGITHGIEPLRAARGACYLAREVITRTGARLHTGTRDHWEAVLNS